MKQQHFVHFKVVQKLAVSNIITMIQFSLCVSCKSRPAQRTHVFPINRLSQSPVSDPLLSSSLCVPFPLSLEAELLSLCSQGVLCLTCLIGDGVKADHRDHFPGPLLPPVVSSV